MGEEAGDSARWLAAAREGSREALGQLLETCRGYLLLVAEKELDPELRAKGGASDLVQQTFLEAQRDFAQFQGTSEAELLNWLRRLLLNNLINFTRQYRSTGKRAVARELGSKGRDSGPARLDGLADDFSSPSSRASGREQAEILEEAVRRLPEEYRQVVLLRYQDELSFEEIGRQLGRSANAARKLWLRALDQLQKEMNPPP